MKKYCLFWGILFISCAASNKVVRPLSEEFEIIGTIRVKFESYLSGEKLDEEAYFYLLEAGIKQFSGGIDIREISWYKEGEDVSARGIVVRADPMKKMESSLEKAAEQIMASLKPSSKIAILYVSSPDPEAPDFIAKELEYIMVTNNFTIIDRSQLDKIRQEQHFQLSGEVDDETAISIGKIVGADIILTGSITGSASIRRLRLRALNTQTAQVMAAGSERL
ncbi:MAG: CsgG/HfaB family protein [Spirochaetaceae bacterium]|jgi:hypothetical protein|nr:CsgG/HfaB family protein [Spirochaetaceae bacterium]